LVASARTCGPVLDASPLGDAETCTVAGPFDFPAPELQATATVIAATAIASNAPAACRFVLTPGISAF
jgi:hypothetical protein